MKINENYKYADKKGNKVLLIEKESGNWIVISEEDYSKLLEIKDEIISIDLLKKIFNNDTLNILINNMLVVQDDYKANNGIIEKDLNSRKNLRLLVLRPTLGCNLACDYCLANAKNNDCRIMSKEIAELSIRKFMESTESNFIQLEFNGGEPFLGFDLIKYAVNIAKQEAVKYNKIIRKIGIQTNGTLLDDEKINWCKNEKIWLGISVDGDETIHNLHRKFPNNKGSYEIIMKNLNKIEDSFGVISVIYSSKEYMNVLKFMVNNKIKNFRFDTLANLEKAKLTNSLNGTYREHALNHISAFKKILDLNKGINERSEMFFDDSITYYIMRLLGMEAMMCQKSPCGAGRIQIAINPNGDILPCILLGDNFVIGNISENRSITEILENSELNKKVRNATVDFFNKCKNCFWKSFCGGGCLGHMDTYIDNPKAENILCNYYSELFSNLIWEVYNNSKDIIRYLEMKFNINKQRHNCFK